MLRRLIVSSTLAALALAPNAAAGVLVAPSGWEWSNPLPQGNSLRALDFAGASGYAAGDFGTLLRSDDDGASWRGLGTATREDLADVQEIDAESVVIAGGCALQRSDDGGASFRPLRWRRGSRPSRTEGRRRCDCRVATECCRSAPTRLPDRPCCRP
jgi:photosystem II stability/assembly factor-like uncharacterized protein